VLFGRVLLDSPHFILAAGLLGGLEVTSKNYGRSTKALPEERSFFLGVCSELEKLGVAIAPGSAAFAKACDEFCEAVLARPNARWRAYFRAAPTDAAADAMLGH
jgi:hypothetical protein